MSKRVHRIGAYSAKYVTDVSYLMTPDVHDPATTPVILSCHGRGLTGYDAVSTPPAWKHSSALVAAGFAVLGIDHARINAWGDPDAMRAIDDAWTYMQGLGYTKSKWGITGASMGGITGLNWMRRNPSKVSCGWFWCPVLDLKFFAKTSAQYTPPYSTTGVTATPWAAEVTSTFAASSTVVGTPTIPALGGTPVTITIADPGVGNQFSDAFNYAVNGKPIAAIGGSTFTYTSKTNTTLIGCVSTSAVPIVVTNGAAVTATFDQNSTSYNPYADPASISAINVPITVYQTSDDITVPPQAALHASNGLVAMVNDPDVTLWTPTPIGGHVIGAEAQDPLTSIMPFFKTYHT